MHKALGRPTAMPAGTGPGQAARPPRSSLGVRPAVAKASATQHRAGSGTVGEGRPAVGPGSAPHPVTAGLVSVLRWRFPAPRHCPEPSGRRGALQPRAPFCPLAAGAALPPQPGGTNARSGGGWPSPRPPASPLPAVFPAWRLARPLLPALPSGRSAPRPRSPPSCLGSAPLSPVPPLRWAREATALCPPCPHRACGVGHASVRHGAARGAAAS